MRFRKGKLGSGFQDFMVSSEWKLHRDFLGSMETQLDTFVHEWQERLDNQAQQIEDEFERDEFYNFFLDDYHEMRQYKVIFMNSFFASSFALFEHQLKRLCDFVQPSRGIPSSVKGSRKNLLKRKESYLTKLGIPFPSDEPVWSRIDNYRLIRNKIMHEGGSISNEWENFTFAEREGIVGGSGDEQRLELTLPFCEQASNDFEQFMLKVNRATRQGV